MKKTSWKLNPKHTVQQISVDYDRHRQVMGSMVFVFFEQDHKQSDVETLDALV